MLVGVPIDVGVTGVVVDPGVVDPGVVDPGVVDPGMIVPESVGVIVLTGAVAPLLGLVPVLSVDGVVTPLTPGLVTGAPDPPVGVVMPLTPGLVTGPELFWASCPTFDD